MADCEDDGWELASSSDCLGDSSEKELLTEEKSALVLVPSRLSVLSWWERVLLTLLKKPPKVEVVVPKKPPACLASGAGCCGAGFGTGAGCGFVGACATGVGLVTAATGAAVGFGLTTSAVARGAGGEVTVGGGAVACAIGLLSARAAIVAGAADMGGKGCGSGGAGSAGFGTAIVDWSVMMALTGGSSVILSDASLMPDEFIDMCRNDELDASDVSAAMVDRVEKSGSETGASVVEDSVVDRVRVVGKRDIPSVHSAKPESVMSSDGKNVPSPRVGRLDLRDSDS